MKLPLSALALTLVLTATATVAQTPPATSLVAAPSPPATAPLSATASSPATAEHIFPVWLRDLLLAGPLCAALVAAVAAGAAWLNVANSRKASHANALLSLLKDYRGEEFRKALRDLRQFKNGSTHRDGFAADYMERVRARDANADKLDTKRRLLAHFFQTLRALMEEKLIDKPVVARTFRASPFLFYVEVVEPIDRAHAAHFRPRLPYESSAPFFTDFLVECCGMERAAVEETVRGPRPA